MRTTTTILRTYFSRSALALPTVAAVMVVGGIALLTWSQFRVTGRARVWVMHTYQVLQTAQELRIAVRDAETAEHDYLLTGDAAYLSPEAQIRARIAGLARDLDALASDNPVREERLRRLNLLVSRRLDEIADTIRMRQEKGADSAGVMASVAGERVTAGIDAALGDMVADERKLLDERLAASDRSQAITSWLSLAGDIIAIALLGLAFGLLALARHRQHRSEAASRDLAAQLRTSLDSISQGVAVFDADGRLVRWNEPLPLLLGLPRPELACGMSYRALAARVAATWTSDATSSDSVDPLLQSEAEGGPIVREQVRGIDGRGFEVRRTPIRGGGFVLTLTDITERIRVERAARETQRIQAIGQLTGGIAHDFNNLLAVVMGNIELALPRVHHDGYVRERLERAMWGTRRGGALTRQLLAFAREQPLAPEPRDIAATLADITGLLGRTMGEHIDVRLSCPDRVWPALIDGTQLESAVLNLALNARDAMPAGGVLTLEVKNCAVDQPYADRHAEVVPGDYVMVAVTDTGTGMTKEVMARAFDPFFTTKEVGHGTGLGLAIVFGFVKQSGGHVDLASVLGVGTTVRLFLPRAREEDSRACDQEDPPCGPGSEATRRYSLPPLQITRPSALTSRACAGSIRSGS